MVPEISASEVFHGHIKVLPVLKGWFHVDNKWIFDVIQDDFFVEDRAHTFL